MGQRQTDIPLMVEQAAVSLWWRGGERERKRERERERIAIMCMYMYMLFFSLVVYSKLANIQIVNLLHCTDVIRVLE